MLTRNYMRYKEIIKNFLKFTVIIFVCFLTYELTVYDNKYINKNTITFDVNNVRNPQIKKIVRSVDNYFSELYFYLSKKKKEQFFDLNKKLYNSLPDEVLFTSNKKNLTISNNLNNNNDGSWPRSHGNHSSNKFSSLKKINSDNINKLKLTWSYKFKSKGVVPGNAIYLNGKIFVSSPSKSLIAISAKDGSQIWEHKTEGKAAVRGLVINIENKKIYFCDQKNLISLNSDTGELNKKFGKNGRINLRHKCQTTPAIVGDEIVIATFEPGVEIYDLSNGEVKWKFYLKEKLNKYFRYGGKRFDYSGGNPWGGISADINRRIVFVSTGNAGRFYEGTSRPGKNKYSNSVVAIDLNKKKLLWEFQEIEHDIWNYDIASPPILTSIKIADGRKIDVVVAPTKFGNTLVLDRITGESLYDYKKIKVPLSKIPGEKSAFYQKKFLLPEPFSKQYFKEGDLTDLFPESEEFIKKKTKGASFGFFEPNSIEKKNIVYKGGAQWMGASIDYNTGNMFVNSSDMPTFIWLEKVNKINSYYRYSSNTEVIKDQFGYPASKPPWGSLTSLNLNTGKINWTVPFGEYEELTKKNIPPTGTINFGGVVGTAGNIIFATGTLDNKIRAFRADNGKEIWNYKMKYLGSSPPTIYEYENEQFILVVSTGSQTIKNQFPKETEYGDMIYVFKISE